MVFKIPWLFNYQFYEFISWRLPRKKFSGWQSIFASSSSFLIVFENFLNFKFCIRSCFFFKKLNREKERSTKQFIFCQFINFEFIFFFRFCSDYRYPYHRDILFHTGLFIYSSHGKIFQIFANYSCLQLWYFKLRLYLSEDWSNRVSLQARKVRDWECSKLVPTLLYWD